jgi:UDP-glucuronate 4-epimerase
VRYSLERPELYADVNVMGTLNMLECARMYGTKHFVYASSSSVYGENAKVPFSESDPVEHPVSVYAATKKATELLAGVYGHVYSIKTTGLRFFTVYGPWGRPDMGVFKFVANIIEGRTIDLFNGGDMRRNFTYIDDIVSGTLVTLDADLPPGSVMNIGGDRDEALMDYIAAVERHAGKKAETRILPMQQGDVTRTVADISKLRALGWSPSTRIDDGVARFVKWYRWYYSADCFR